MDFAVLFVAGAALALAPQPPPVQAHDVDRFPPDPVVEEQRALGCLYRRTLLERMDVEPRNAALAAAYAASAEADDAWGLLFLVRPGPVSWESGPGYLAVEFLTKLRDRIGAEAYAAGAMPPLVPPWACTPVE